MQHSQLWGLTLLLAVGLTTPLLAEDAAPIPSTYALEFLATASWGVGMNDAGLVVGERSVDVGCGSSCLAPTEMVVWDGDEFVALPAPAHLPDISVESINNSAWVVGTGRSGADSRTLIWKPIGEGYEVIEVGSVPGIPNSEGIAIDNTNRVLGYASESFPPAAAPFVWTEADGFTELTELGFPADPPRTMSPGGTVAYLYGWYQLDVPGVVHPMAPTPPGFLGPGWYVAINDAGDQVRLLGPTSGSALFYAFRYFNHGEWQQIYQEPGQDSSPFGVGSVTAGGDIVATIDAAGLLAQGPAGGAIDLTGLLSPAYGDAYVTEAAQINESGEVLAQVMIGRSQRLVRLVESEPCTSDCIQVSRLLLRARFVDDPSDPGHCTDVARTQAMVRMRVTDETGAPLAGVRVTGRFLDDYWLDGKVQGVTDSQGGLRFVHSGPACVGAIAFLVTEAELAGRTFDRGSGTLQQWLIPAL